MKDIIYREDAVGAINGWLKLNHFPEFGDGMLHLVPSADRWIPCSERLPNDWEHVLVCVPRTYINPISVDWYVDEIGSWANEGDSVIAWMPLPEPYKGEDDE